MPSQQGALVNTARFQLITLWCATSGVLSDCGPNCIQITNNLCSFGLVHHLSHYHPHPMKQDLAWGSTPRESTVHSIFLSFLNKRTSSRNLLTRLLADGLVARSSFVQIYNFVPDVL